MSRLIDADALCENLGFAKNCNDCKIGKNCTYETFSVYGICTALADAPTVGGWVSVKDRLPENEQYVMLWTKTGVMKYAKYLDNEPHRPWITYDEDGSIRAWDNVVTHWMPLPEPPKEDKEDA